MYVIIATATEGKIYEIIITTGVTSTFKSLPTPRVPKVLDGTPFFFWDTEIKKFYNLILSSGQFEEYDLSSTLTAAGNAVWYPNTVQAIST